MEFTTKLLRSQFALLKPFMAGCSIETARKGQDKLGALMSRIHKKDVSVEKKHFEFFEGAMIHPKSKATERVLLYLHGGGYICGDITYAIGFGTAFAAKCGIQVFCAAYRLAPESPFPAALEDALCAYRHLLNSGFAPSDIVLGGESAGGGLIYALCIKLKRLGMPLPSGIIAISPWMDLTLSGGTYESNRTADPFMTATQLKYYADCYVHGDSNGTDDDAKDLALKENPLVSPLGGDLADLPPSLIFAGGDEILLDDARMLHVGLLAAGSQSKLIVTPNMWHAYVLYCLRENSSDFDAMRAFLAEL